MGPALQRLLARPSSLEFLRFLVGNPTKHAPAKRRGRLGGIRGIGGTRGIGGIGGIGGIRRECRWRHASFAAAAREGRDYDAEERQSAVHRREPPSNPDTVPSFLPIPLTNASSATTSLSNLSNRIGISTKNRYGQWDESLWTHEQLEFESNLDMVPTEQGKVRLLDRNRYRDDLKLWACLLEYRKRIHGSSGVLTFWNAVQKGNLHLPTKGFLAEKFWPEFLALGFQDNALLDQVCGYADRMLDQYQERWSRLYVHTVQHFLISKQGERAVKWHERLLSHHPPGPKAFAEMCRQVTFTDGDMEALRTIYTRNSHRNAYSKVVPLLCQREDFRGALNWHTFFLRMGDLPSSSKVVEPLVHFLTIYDRPNALKVTKGLVDSGASFASRISKELNDNTKISREMMNLVHGKTFNVAVKKYNDSLGARWFATRWVSLDVAINAVHALGVQEIGPLSLQAIALRDPEPKAVVLRINQLRDLGISTGDSLFSRAVEHFARNRKYDLLEGLLYSDQHPKELEDGALQESLLTSYARAKDWSQYRRTLEIRSLVSKSPAMERSNIALRCLITGGSRTAVMEKLANMQTSGTPVTSKTIAHLIRYMLRPRRQGRRPVTLAGQRNRGAENDLNMVVAILKRIMRSGNFVPILHWREIIRRLGMLGRFDDLQNLCRFLASWYGPRRSSFTYRPRRFRLPAQVPTFHYLHPLKMLFNVSLQKSIVEWGFIHNLKRRPIHLDSIRSTTPTRTQNKIPDITSGVILLKELNEHGVHINGKSVRSALFNRLITYYGPGRSSRRYNRYGKARLRGKIDLVAKQLDDALGGTYFTGVDLPKIVHVMAVMRLRRIDRRTRNKMEARRLGPVRRLGIDWGGTG